MPQQCPRYVICPGFDSNDRRVGVLELVAEYGLREDEYFIYGDPNIDSDCVYLGLLPHHAAYAKMALWIERRRHGPEQAIVSHATLPHQRAWVLYYPLGESMLDGRRVDNGTIAAHVLDRLSVNNGLVPGIALPDVGWRLENIGPGYNAWIEPHPIECHGEWNTADISTPRFVRTPVVRRRIQSVDSRDSGNGEL